MPGSHRYTLREQVVMASDPTIDVHTRQTPAADRTPASRSIDRDRTENRPYLVLDGAGGRSSTIDRDRDLARLKERAASVPSSVIDVEGAGIDFEPKDREGGLRAFLDRRKVGRNFGYSSLDVVPRDTDPEQNSRDIRGVAAKTRASPFEPAPWRSDVRQATRFSNQEPHIPRRGKTCERKAARAGPRTRGRRRDRDQGRRTKSHHKGQGRDEGKTEGSTL